MTPLEAGTAIFIGAIIGIIAIAVATMKGLEDPKRDTPFDDEACLHLCTSECRRSGCNCLCGEYHCPPEGVCRYADEGDCPNHDNQKQ